MFTFILETAKKEKKEERNAYAKEPTVLTGTEMPAEHLGDLSNTV